MKQKKWLLLIIVALLVLALAAPVMAAKKKGKKKKKGKQPAKMAQQDPWAGRWGLSFGGGGVNSPAGFGFEGRIGVTYYVNRYLHLSVTPGFGTYPIAYEAPDGDDKETNIKYTPVDLSLIITPVRSWRFAPYFGPGVGITYYWWTQEVRDPDDSTQTIDEDKNETLYSAFATAGISTSLGGNFVANFGLTYTIPDVNEFSTEDGNLTFGFGGGVVF